jgi:hypothetical protein
MKLKSIIVTVAILAVLSAVVFVARRPGPPASKDPRVGQPILDRSAVEKAAKFRLSDQGKTVVLTRQADGSWRDTSYFDLPADFSKLSGLIGNLTEDKIDRLVTSNPERIARLEFKDTKIELLDSADKPVWSLTLGKSAETGSGRFVRFDDEPKAYLATLNAWLDSEAKNWAEGDLLKLKPEEVAKVEVSFAPEAADKSATTDLVLSRANKDAPWTADKTPANEKVKADRVSSLLNAITTVHFTDTTDLKDANAAAAKAHERTVKLTTFDGKTYTVAMGRKPEEKKLKPATPAAAKPEVPKALKPGPEGKSPPEKPAAPEYETIPAGPVFVTVSSSDASAPVNALMQKRAFEVGEYTFTSLPQKADEFFEAAPPPPAPAAKPAEPTTKAEPKPEVAARGKAEAKPEAPPAAPEKK